MEEFILKYRQKGILLDTHLLLLLLIGIFDEEYIEEFKRTQDYSIEDFNIVRNLVLIIKKLIVTPQILAEISNLSLQMHESKLKKYFFYFIDIIENSDEIHIDKNKLLKIDLLPKYGVTDLSIYESAKKYKFLVFTEDFKLFNFLSHENIDVINLNHIRTFLWLK